MPDLQALKHGFESRSCPAPTISAKLTLILGSIFMMEKVIDSDTFMVLHESMLHLIRQIHHNGEEVIREKRKEADLIIPASRSTTVAGHLPHYKSA